MLDEMMTMQKNLQARLGTNFAELSDTERAQFMRNHRGYLEDELAEALYEMPNYKLWKDYSTMSPEAKEIAWQKVRMELIDAFHFFMNLMLCAGMTADEVFKMYIMKNKENFERQDRGYTAEVSYREQPVNSVMSHKPMCTVAMVGEVMTSDNFVAFVETKDGGVRLIYNADVLTMGIAAKMSTDEFNELYATLPEDVQARVMEALERGDTIGQN